MVHFAALSDHAELIYYTSILTSHTYTRSNYLSGSGILAGSLSNFPKGRGAEGLGTRLGPNCVTVCMAAGGIKGLIFLEARACFSVHIHSGAID